jgi:hypothetical protein
MISNQSHYVSRLSILKFLPTIVFLIINLCYHDIPLRQAIEPAGDRVPKMPCAVDCLYNVEAPRA